MFAGSAGWPKMGCVGSCAHPQCVEHREAAIRTFAGDLRLRWRGRHQAGVRGWRSGAPQLRRSICTVVILGDVASEERQLVLPGKDQEAPRRACAPRCGEIRSRIAGESEARPAAGPAGWGSEGPAAGTPEAGSEGSEGPESEGAQRADQKHRNQKIRRQGKPYIRSIGSLYIRRQGNPNIRSQGKGTLSKGCLSEGTLSKAPLC